jgi:hypothetical protein
MLRMTTALVSTIALFAASCFAALVGAGATSAPTTWPRCSAPTVWESAGLRGKLRVNACGPTKVVRGINYSYTVLLTNISKTRFRRVELSFIHYDAITRSSRPYRREERPEYSPMSAAVWALSNCKPHQTFRVGIRLPFLQHNDPKGSNFVIEARTREPKHFSGGLFKDVVFVRRS